MGFVDSISSKKYIAVETYKRDGQGIVTPVWFCIKDDHIHVVTRSETGKAKRLRRDQRVKIAECTMRGEITGPWTDGVAEILDELHTKEAVALRDKKYGMAATVAKLLTRGKGRFFAFKISVPT